MPSRLWSCIYIIFRSHKSIYHNTCCFGIVLSFTVPNCGTIHLFWFLIQALHSTSYMVNFTTIQCRQNFGYASFNSYSFHFSLYSSSMYFSFEHCKLSTYCACSSVFNYLYFEKQRINRKSTVCPLSEVYFQTYLFGIILLLTVIVDYHICSSS